MRKQIVNLVVIATLFTAQACVKNATTPEENNPTKVQDLNVPATFNWETSKTITCTVNSTVAVQVGIYSDKECVEELLATFTTSGSNIIPLSVPSATTSLYIKYKSTSGSDKIVEQSLDNSVITFTISDAATKSVAGTKADGDIPIYDGGGYISYPAGWGTVLFEDLFPAIGDYDFNDYVLSYQVAVEFPWRDGKYDTEHSKQIRIHLRLKAVGGALAFTPYVRVVGLDKNIVSMPNPPYNDPKYVNPGVFNNTTDGVKVNLVDSKLTSDVIVEFANLNASNPFKVQGAAFYNTTQGKTTTFNQLTEVFVYLAFSKEQDVKNLLDKNIDIFLASADKTKEIHVRGFNPVFSEYDFAQAGVNKAIPYASDKNLVWGVKIPQEVKFQHVVEKVNFCDAYKDFAAWATSGGTTNLDWYKTNRVKENLIEWAK